MIPVPIIDALVFDRPFGGLRIRAHLSSAPSPSGKVFPMHIDYRMVDGDPTRLEVVE